MSHYIAPPAFVFLVFPHGKKMLQRLTPMLMNTILNTQLRMNLSKKSAMAPSQVSCF